MGRICRICDRKFMLRGVFKAYQEQIDHYTHEAEVIEGELEQVKVDVDELKEQKEQVSDLIYQEKETFQGADQIERQKQQVLTNELTLLLQEKETLKQQI